jgi:hypothetical protein
VVRDLVVGKEILEIIVDVLEPLIPRCADYGFAMKDQIHIRNAEAAHLARTLARQARRTITEVVLDALRQYRPDHREPNPVSLVENWHRLLRDDRKRQIGKIGTPMEALYDDGTGLPK